MLLNNFKANAIDIVIIFMKGQPKFWVDAVKKLP